MLIAEQRCQDRRSCRDVEESVNTMAGWKRMARMRATSSQWVLLSGDGIEQVSAISVSGFQTAAPPEVKTEPSV